MYYDNSTIKQFNSSSIHQQFNKKGTASFETIPYLIIPFSYAAI